jgi:Uma2 family endonuclease
MVVRWNETRVKEAREAMSRLDLPFLMRNYDADPDDFEALSDEDFRCEYVDGVLIVHSPASPKHEDRCSFLLFLLRGFAARRRLGSVLSSNSVMQIGERRFCPDGSFLAMNHADRVQPDRIEGPMDLVFEVLSQSTRAYDLDEKRSWYREAQVPEIWLIDPAKRQFHVDWLHGAGGKAHADYQTELLETGRWHSRVLTGFWIDVEWLWAEPLPNDYDCLTRILGST